jgi:phage host-nuclease inhibitor protein Gam
MARTRLKSEPRFTGWEDVDNALHQIQAAEAMLTRQELALNKTIAAAKGRAEESARPFQAAIKQIGQDIKEFVAAHKDELDGKTKKLNFGSTGFRMSTCLVIPRGKDGDVLAALKAMGLTDCVKTTESIRKDILKQQSEATILRAGAYLKPADEFWYETEKQEIQDTGD